MQTARRIYLYLLSGIGLTIAAIGLGSLLELAVREVSRSAGGSTILSPSESDIRGQLSLALSFAAVATPVWAIHWWLAERGLRSPTTGESERTAPIRAFYLAAVEFVALVVALFSGAELIGEVARRAIGHPLMYATGEAGPLARLVVGLLVWAFHAWIRSRDERGGDLHRSVAWWPRLAWYALAFIGGLMLCLGAADVIQTGLNVAVGRWSIATEVAPWVEPLTGGLGRLVAGGLVFAGLWLGLDRRLRSDDWVGPSERSSTIRVVFLTAAIIVGAGATLFAAASGISAVFDRLLGVSPDRDWVLVIEDAVGPSISFLPFTVGWWWARRRSHGEGRRFVEAGGEAAARGWSGYASAAVGLAFAGVGIGWLIGLLVDVVFGGHRTVIAGGPDWQHELGVWAAATIAGAPLWLWHWLAAVSRRTARPADEAGATPRRVYLYAVLATAIITSISALAVIVYRVFGAALGATAPTDPVSELSTPVGAAIVAGAVVAYHGLALRGDLRLREAVTGGPATAAPATTALSPSGEPVAAAASVGAVAPEPVVVPVIVVGPPGFAPEAVIAGLRAVLPPGYEVRTAGPASGVEPGS